MYLKGFAEVKGSGNKEKAYVWQFNVETLQQTALQININDICFVKNMYEFRSKDNAFIARNTIEKTFGKIESTAGAVIESIKHRSQNDKCLNCTNFLTEEEKSILIIFITTLIYRNPDTIERGIDVIMNNNDDTSYTESRNFTLMNLLPLGVDAEWDQNTIIRTAIKNLSGMAFQIGIASNDVIFTSDRPYVQWPSQNEEYPNRPKALIFPLTSRLVLYLYPVEDVDPVGWNYLFQLNEDKIQEVQANIAICAKKWLYSHDKLTENEIEIIKEARG